MRVVARQRVNEVVTDSLLLERARRQISALRRRLVEAEAAAAIAPSLAPPHHPLPSEKANRPPASAKTPVLPLPFPAETKAVVSAAPETSGASFDGSDDNGSIAVGRDETARFGGGRWCEKDASFSAVPRGSETEEHPAGEKLNGSSNNRGGSEGATKSQVEASSLRRCANTGVQPRGLVLKAEAKSPPQQRPLQADEGTPDRDVNNGHLRPLASSSLSGGREGRKEEGVKTQTLLNARRGRDIVVRSKIATAVAAANAAAAAATAVASAISAAGGGRGRLALANKHATPAASYPADMRHGSSRTPVRSRLRKPEEVLRTTRVRRPAFRSSCFSASGRPAPPARRAYSPTVAVAPTIGVAEARGRHIDETSVATQALIERFSSREEELLLELEAWKARCKSLEKKEALPRSIGGGCALAGKNGGGAGERSVGEMPTRLGVGENKTVKPTRLDAAPTATRAVPSDPAPAKLQRPLQATPEASPAIGISEEETPDATQASADTHRLARGGVGTMSVPKTFVPEKGRNVDSPRRASIEVCMYRYPVPVCHW